MDTMASVSPGTRSPADESSSSRRRQVLSSGPSTGTDASLGLEAAANIPLQNDGISAVQLNGEIPLSAMAISSSGLVVQLQQALFGRQPLLPRYQPYVNDSDPMTLRHILLQLVKITFLVGYTLSAVAPYVRVRSRWIPYGFQLANAAMLFIVLPLWGLLNGRLATSKTFPKYLTPYFVCTLLGQGIGHAIAYSYGYYAITNDGWPALFLTLQTLVFWWVELYFVQHEKED